LAQGVEGARPVVRRKARRHAAVREWLSAVGIDYAQGFLLDQPRALTTLAGEPAKK